MKARGASLLPVTLLTLLWASSGDLRAQQKAQPQQAAPAANATTFGDPAAQNKAYLAILANPDPAKRAQDLEIFIAYYPNSALLPSAYEQLMAAWQSAKEPAKADVAASRLLQIDPDNVRALANRVYVARTRLAVNDTAALTVITTMAERGLAAVPKWRRPASLDEAEFARLKLQMTAVFDSALGFAAMQVKDYARARRYCLDSVTIEPDNFQDVYQLTVALIEGTPIDPQGFWYAARAITLARQAKNDQAAASIDAYARARYRTYHGSEEGWERLMTRVAAGERVPPENFSRSISRALTAPEMAVQAVSEHDPGSLSFADWEFILAQRDTSPANRDAAEKVWKAIGEKQKGGEARLKIPVKVISATPERIEAAITDANQSAGTADVEIALLRPLAPLPSPGVVISVIGVLSDYQPKPFLFRMTQAELADESLPIAGGPCADPRPQACTRDFRPACGTHRDGGRKTYGNACSACADPEVVTQAAGSCP
jgi:tetratricopeptide (TPR) repeat protein